MLEIAPNSIPTQIATAPSPAFHTVCLIFAPSDGGGAALIRFGISLAASASDPAKSFEVCLDSPSLNSAALLDEQERYTQLFQTSACLLMQSAITRKVWKCQRHDSIHVLSLQTHRLQ